MATAAPFTLMVWDPIVITTVLPPYTMTALWVLLSHFPVAPTAFRISFNARKFCPFFRTGLFGVFSSTPFTTIDMGADAAVHAETDGTRYSPQYVSANTRAMVSYPSCVG
ncbi:hypothetical protein D3C74_431960 [compost metagenome]